GRVLDDEPDELVRVPRILLVLVVDGDEQEGAAQRLGGGAVGHLDEPGVPGPAALGARGDGEGAAVGRVGGQHGAGGEAPGRVVRADLEPDHALQPVRGAHAGDD